jgi:hypothetical protein
VTTEAWSCGGGTQSAAIAALIVRGDLPKPDYALIADTGREMGTTWEYADAVLKPALREEGVELVRVVGLATVGLRSHKGKLLLPAFQRNGGAVERLPTYCSNEWKRRPILRWLRALGVDRARLWLGISCDEAHRMKPSSEAWVEHWYPLIERELWRKDCITLTRSVGWPDPPRSRCWCCPQQANGEWREVLAGRHRGEAITLDEEIRSDGFYLHRNATPLGDADTTGGNQAEMFDGCDSGVCFV